MGIVDYGMLATIDLFGVNNMSCCGQVNSRVVVNNNRIQHVERNLAGACRVCGSRIKTINKYDGHKIVKYVSCMNQTCRNYSQK